MADFLVALADFDQRSGWRRLGYPSLFVYLQRELQLSPGAAYSRKAAADLVQRFPGIAAAFQNGSLCLSIAAEVAKVLTQENYDEVLPRFFRASFREAERIVAVLRPALEVPVRDVVVPIRTIAASASLVPAAQAEIAGRVSVAPEPQSRSAVNASPAAQGSLAGEEAGGAESMAGPRLGSEMQPGSTAGVSNAMTSSNSPLATPSAPARPPQAPTIFMFPAAKRESVEFLDGERARLHTTVTRAFLEKLDRAKAARSHAQPLATTAAILEFGLDLLLEAHAKRHGATGRRRAGAGRSRRREYVPANVKRAVRERAGNRCEWCFENGEVCGETKWLEYDHVIPLALGGLSTVDNVRLLCRGHNQLAARRIFGDAWMDRFTAGTRLRKAMSA